MKKLLGIVVLGLLVSSFAFASNLNPEKILNNVDDFYRSNASYGILTLSVTTTN
jgi:outer membrane lipoprotein-sorting protein